MNGWYKNKRFDLGASFQQGYALGVMNTLTDTLEDIFIQSSDLSFSFTTGTNTSI